MKRCVCVCAPMCIQFLGIRDYEGNEVGDSFACLKYVQGDLSK